MNLELFVAKRIFRGKDSANSLSKPIVNIAVAGIAIGVAVMILSVAIVTGFQREITNKVTGFDSHLKVVSLLDGSDEYNKLVIDHRMLENLRLINGVEKVRVFAEQPGIVEFNKEIAGVNVKGLDSLYERTFFEKYLLSGKLPDFKDPEKNEILISKVLADKLGFKLSDKITVYFVNRNKPATPRNFKVTGIFNSGLAVFDEKVIFISLTQLQRVKGYGLQVFLQQNDDGTLSASAFGGDKKYRYHWNNRWYGPGPHALTADSSLISVVLTDQSKTLADTAFFDPRTGNSWSSGGSNRFYVDGYDLFLTDISRLNQIEEEVYDKLAYNLVTKNIMTDNPEIFNWLEILDVNVYIIIILLAVVAVINMSSALLIIILERANLIGILKAIGAENASIRKIFLWHGSLLITRGLILGNIVALGLGFLQQSTGLVTLPEAQYYVSAVPVKLSLMPILLLNGGVLLVSVLVLLLPAMLVAKLSPTRTIRFE